MIGNKMKKLFLVLAAVCGLVSCGTYETRVDYPYYHYSCVDYNAAVVCGNHYYGADGIVYYHDSRRGVWVGHERYRYNPARPEYREHERRDHEPHPHESHGRY